jgi:hypothetical protein
MNKQDLRERVLAFFSNPPQENYEKYNKAFQLYRESEGKDYNQERVYNAGFTDMNLKNLLYDLQKINTVADLEIAKAIMVVVADTVDGTIELDPLAEVGFEGIDQGQDEGDENQIKSAVNIQNVLTGDGTGTQEPEFISAPTSDERAKLRDDFPFLNDANCPDELKVLVADKITAYKAYVKGQSDLVKHANGDLALEEDEAKNLAAQVVENFEKNREIYEELNYYGIHGKILGNHSIFAALTLEREVCEMSTEECFKYLNSSKKFISVKQTALEELVAKKPKGYQAKMTVLVSAIEARKEKVSLVKKYLGISE